jgi:hypothetical protein
VGFEPTISAFERAKTVLALDRMTTVIGLHNIYSKLIIPSLIEIDAAVGRLLMALKDGSNSDGRDKICFDIFADYFCQDKDRNPS